MADPEKTLLRRLESSAARLNAAKTKLAADFGECIDAGIPHSVIAEAMGVSKQAVVQRALRAGKGRKIWRKASDE